MCSTRPPRPYWKEACGETDTEAREDKSIISEADRKYLEAASRENPRLRMADRPLSGVIVTRRAAVAVDAYSDQVESWRSRYLETVVYNRISINWVVSLKFEIYKFSLWWTSSGNTIHEYCKFPIKLSIVIPSWDIKWKEKGLPTNGAFLFKQNLIACPHAYTLSQMLSDHIRKTKMAYIPHIRILYITHNILLKSYNRNLMWNRQNGRRIPN